jgi:diacylglycerol kinase (ATP)
MEQVHVVGNRADPVAARQLAALTEAREVTATQPTTAATAAAITAAVLHDGARRVVVVGGDGMVHAAVNALAPLAASGAEVSLGIVPLGTGNDFARALGIPLDDTPAACAIAIGAAAEVDLLHCDHGWVASVATCGFPARVNERANRMRWPKGSTKYTLATLLEMPRLRPDHLRITVDDHPPLSGDYTIVAVANTGWFGGGMHIAPAAQPSDALADLVLTEALGRGELLRYLPRVFSGGHGTHPRTSFCTASAVHLDGSPDVQLWGDGEPLGPLPVTLRAVPAALRVARPIG